MNRKVRKECGCAISSCRFWYFVNVKNAISSRHWYFYSKDVNLRKLQNIDKLQKIKRR